MPFRGKHCFPVQRGRDEPTPDGGGGVLSHAPIGDSVEVSPGARRPAGAGDASPGAGRLVGGEAESPGAGRLVGGEAESPGARRPGGGEAESPSAASGGGRARPRAPKKRSQPYPAPGKDRSVQWGRCDSTPGGGGAGRASTSVGDSAPVTPEERSQFEGKEGYPGAGSEGGRAAPRAAKKLSGLYPAAGDASKNNKLRRFEALKRRITSRSQQWEAEDSSSSDSGCVNPKWAARARASTQVQGRSSSYKAAGYCWRCRERPGRKMEKPLLHICTCSSCGGGCIVCSSTISAVSDVQDMEGESHVLKSLLATSPGWSRQAECSGARRPLESVLPPRRRSLRRPACEDCPAAAHWSLSCGGVHLCSSCLELGYRGRHGLCTADGAPGIIDSSAVDLDEEDNSYYCHRSSRFIVREQRGYVLEQAEVFEIRYYTSFTDLHCHRRALARRRVVLYQILPSSHSVRMCHFEIDPAH